MKHITFGDKSLLVGDAVADALLEYAAALTNESHGDTVEVAAIGSDGDEVTATFLLGPGVTMMAETAHSNLPEPDNTAAIEYMERARMRPLASPSVVSADSQEWQFSDTYGVDDQLLP
jgi:hypothetical protein